MQRASVVFLEAVRGLSQRPEQRLAGRAEPEQDVVGEHEQRRPQDGDQRDVVVRLREPAQQVLEVEDFLSAEEAGPARRGIGDAMRLQRLLEEMHVLEAAQQNRDVSGTHLAVPGGALVPYGPALPQQRLDLGGDEFRFGQTPPACLLGVSLRGQRHEDGVRPHRRVRGSPGHRLHRRPASGAEGEREELVGARHELSMRAE